MTELLAYFIWLAVPLAIILFFACSAAMIARMRNEDLIASRVVWANIAIAMGIWILYGLFAPDQYQRHVSYAGFWFSGSTGGFRLKLALGGLPHLFWWITMLIAITATTTFIALADNEKRDDNPTGSS